MTENEFNKKVYDSIKQSTENITPPPFYQVLQKAAQNEPIENYDEIFDNTFSKKRDKKILSGKIIGIAAAFTIFIGLSAVIGSSFLYMGSPKSDECTQDYSAEFGYAEDNQSTVTKDQVSQSDVENETSSQIYAE